MGLFSLEKWYLDATSDRGEALIAHWARLRLGPISLLYAALLHTSPTTAPVMTSSLASAPPPLQDPAGTTWLHGELSLHFSMQGRVLSSPHTLAENAAGQLVWTPVHVDALATAQTPAFSLSGRGYAEHLRLTMAPWKLPIRVLHWGRWIGARHCLVWIRWEGPAPLTRLLVDGEPCTGEMHADESCVRHASCSLRLEPARTLRDAPFDDTLAEHAPRMRDVVSPAFLRSHETRWLSKGRLSVADEQQDVGWAIHEQVRFCPE